MIFRIRDIFISLAVLGLSSPVLLVIIMTLSLTQKRVFFFQIRPGLDEKPFTLIKFSTMRDILLGEKEEEDQQKRLTSVGKWLRKTSLDELPQLWNVLKGDMSLVGPRPLLMDYLPLYTELEKKRHSVKPGITGWAQIHGRNSLSFKERFALDTWYVEQKSFLLDMEILWKTFLTVWRKEGIYADELTTSPKFDGTN
ncbi:MAG: sugar transferase [Bacteroidota bacterium]